MEENTLILLLGGALLILAILVWLFSAGKKERQAPRVKELFSLEQFAALKTSQPVFYETLRSYAEKRSLSDLVRDEEVRLALNKLSEAVRPADPKGRKSAGLQGLGLDEASSGIGASYYPPMLTVIRAMYSDSDFAAGVPAELQGDTDRFLDSLTDEGGGQV